MAHPLLSRRLMHPGRFVCMLVATLYVSAAPPRQMQPAVTAQAPEHGKPVTLKAKGDAIGALKSGEISMAEAVRRVGGELTLDAAPNPDYFQTDFDGLKAESQIVVLVHRRRDADIRVQLSDNGRSVVTRYELAVDDVGLSRDRRVKRNTLKRVTVEVPGGVYPLPDGRGTVEVINGPTFEAGQSYLLFLQPKSSKNSASASDAASEGIFVVTGYHYEGIMPVASSFQAPVEDMRLASAPNQTPSYDRDYVQSVFARLHASR